MKKHLLIFISLFVTFSLCQAQDPTLWGMTSEIGTYNFGSLFRYDIATGKKTEAHDFGRITDGQSPRSTLIQANNGLLYGTTRQSGVHEGGIIFSYDISAHKETDVHDFGSAPDGNYPTGSLIQASNGLLYGMTSEGGTYNYFGTIFSYDISSGKETDLYDFGSGTGFNPVGSLFQASNGLLYGMTVGGGSNDSGTFFSFNISTRVVTDLYDFGIGTGLEPTGALFQASNGLLYSVTTKGGKNDLGIIFSYNISTNKESDLYSFNGGNDGAFPNGKLLQTSSGLLFGLTSKGGTYNVGTIFSYDFSSSQETALYDFDSSNNDGELPLGSLIIGSDSFLYGLTSKGGNKDSGVIFSYNAQTESETVLYDFGNDSDGQSPFGSLIQDSNGALFGTTACGGAYTWGIIFSFDVLKNTEVDLHDFGGNADGGFPYGSLIQATNGLVYGMTSEGGIFKAGTIFSYDLSKDTEINIYNFGRGTARGHPNGSLIESYNGFLYGMTLDDGKYGLGTIFSYDISSGKETDLYDFAGGIDGSVPSGSLLLAKDSLLFGMTGSGGSNGVGVFFNYNTVTGKETVLHNFGIPQSSDGSFPHSSLIQASNALLYGMTPGSVNGHGSIFTYNTSTGVYSEVYDFINFNKGVNPQGVLVQESNGLLYGLAQGGGKYDYGTIFSCNTSTDSVIVLYDFGSGSDGQSPEGSLFQTSDGLLYGMTELGGIYGRGTIFSFDISTAKETPIYNFGIGEEGAFPVGDLLEVNTPMGIKQLPNSTVNIQFYPNPSSSSIHFSITLQQEQVINLTLYNTLGQQVWAENLGKTKQVETTIPVIDLANGVYLLKVNSGGESVQKEVVVEK